MRAIYTLIFVLALSISSIAGEQFFLKRYVSVVTDSGIVGFPVGTLVIKEGDKYTSNGHELKITEKDLLIQEKIAGALAAADAKIQSERIRINETKLVDSKAKSR